MRIYLDNSVLNRPYDDQSQPRVWLETLCFVLILQMFETGEAELIESTFNVLENNENPNQERKEWVAGCLTLARHTIPVTAEMKLRANALVKEGLKPLDAAHLAAAESALADFFVTCDDRLIRKYRGALRVLTPTELVLILLREQS